MKITEIRMSILASKDNFVKAVAGIVLDDMIAIHGIKIVQLKNKTIVSMPSRKDDNGKWVDLVHPINHDMRKYIDENILTRFYALIQKKIDELQLPENYRVEYDLLNINMLRLISNDNSQNVISEYIINDYSKDTLKETLSDMLDEIEERN